MLLTFEEDANEDKLSMFVNGVEFGDSGPSRVALKTTEPMSNDKLSLLWKCFGTCIEELYLTVPKSLSLSSLSSLCILELTLVAMSLVDTSTINVLSVHCLESLTLTARDHVTDVRNISCEAISTFLSSCSLKELCVKKRGVIKMEEIVKGMCGLH